MNRISARLAAAAAAVMLVGLGTSAAAAATPLSPGDALYAISCPQTDQPEFPTAVQLWGVNATTAVSTPIGSGSGDFEGLCAGQPAWNPLTNTAWVILLTDDHDEPSVLAQIDVATGAVTPGALLLDDGEPVPVASLAIGLDGAAYAISYTQLYSVDLTTGELTPIGGTLPTIYGFSVDPTTGTFWALAASSDLIEIDVTTGDFTFGPSLELSGVYGLQIDSAGALWVIGVNDDEPTLRTQLYSASSLAVEEPPTTVGLLTVTDVGQPFSQALLLVPGAPNAVPGSEPSLAATGASPAPLIAGAMLLLIGGLALTMTRRVRAGR